MTTKIYKIIISIRVIVLQQWSIRTFSAVAQIPASLQVSRTRLARYLIPMSQPMCMGMSNCSIICKIRGVFSRKNIKTRRSRWHVGYYRILRLKTCQINHSLYKIRLNSTVSLQWQSTIMGSTKSFHNICSSSSLLWIQWTGRWVMETKITCNSRATLLVLLIAMLQLITRLLTQTRLYLVSLVAQ